MRVHSLININLSNGETVTVEQLKMGDIDTNVNVISSIKITEELSVVNKNPLGSIAYNNITIRIQSGDNSLTPENKESPYYGYMNSTAILSVLVEDDEGEIEFGTFYVDRWYSNISSEERKSITIEGSGYMKSISKMLLPSMQIRKNQYIRDYVLELISKQNEKLSDRYKIQVDEDISFGEYEVMEFSDIEASTIGEALETISQCTLTNVYIDRDNKLKTDYCFDDTPSGDEYVLGDCVNIKRIKVGDGGLSDYTGVEVKYSSYIVNNISTLAQLDNQKLESGDTEFNNISSNSKIFKLLSVSVDSDSKDDILIKSVQYDRNKLNVVIHNSSEEEANANILFTGQTLNENQLSVEKYISDEKGTCLSVTNNIIGASNIDSFANKLLSLIGTKNTTVQASGWFNGRMKLGDIVYLDAEKTINTKGYYKVIGLEWLIETTLQCTAKLIRLVGS